MSLRNHWNPFNLRSSPFFQDTLRSGSDARYPIDLFVGREKETQHLLAEIGSSLDSRQVIPGAPGFGKTTLVQYVKHQAARSGIYSYPDPVSLKSLDSADELLVRILRYVHDTLYSSGSDALRASDAMKTAKHLVLAFRVKSGGFSVSVLGTGAGGQVEHGFQQSPFIAPFLIVPRLLRDLVKAAEEHERHFSGLLVHMNNLENLSDAESNRAGAIVRDVRDIFLLDKFHFILVGTPGAVRDVIAAYAQVRSVFMVHEPLAPLSFTALTKLLVQRYEYLKLQKSKPVHQPVEQTALRELHQLFGGDLRGLLRSLNHAANQLLGYLGEQGASPMTAQRIHAVLQPHYLTEIASNLSANAMDYFQRLATLPQTPFTQSSLASAWRVSQSMVSKILDELRKFGYVYEVSREGRKVLYDFNGVAYIALSRRRVGTAR